MRKPNRRGSSLMLASLLLVTLLAACSGGDFLRGRDGEVGKYVDGGTSSRAGSGGGNAGRDAGIEPQQQPLSVDVRDPKQMKLEVITVACAGDCVDVEAVAHEGNPPYAFKWEDGSTDPKRHVCPSAAASYSVTATDTAIKDVEFSYAGQTATTTVSATVLDCSDAGLAADGGPGNLSAYWTTWTAVTVGAPGDGAGKMTSPSGDVNVSFAGEVVMGSAITGQPSPAVGGLVNITFTPVSSYTSTTVTNPPPATGMIGVTGDAKLTQTITFSKPVRDPLLAIVSLGNIGTTATWHFDSPPTVLSMGPGVLNQPGVLTASGNDLSGNEGNGVVQFSGTFNTLSFTVTAPEVYASLTVGIPAGQ